MRYNAYQLLCPIAYQLLSYLVQHSFYLCMYKNIIQEQSQYWRMKSIRHIEMNSTGTKGFIAFLKNMHVLYAYIFLVMNKKYSSGTITHMISCWTLKIICHVEINSTGSSMVYCVFGKHALSSCHCLYIYFFNDQ